MKEQKLKKIRKIIFSIVILTLILFLGIEVAIQNKNIILKINESEINENLKYEETYKSINDLKEGEYIKYDTGVSTVGENGIITCVVLYDSTSEYGVQIISTGTIGTVSIGDDNFYLAKDSYNNAISTLNKEARKYLNKKYARSARSVGSIPDNPNSETSTYYKTTYSYAKSLNEMFKDADLNYKADDNQMNKLDIMFIGEEYWLASRYNRAAANLTGFPIRYISPTKNDGHPAYDICGIYSEITIYGNVKYNSKRTMGLRPCFTLNSNLITIDGDGKTEETAYVLGTKKLETTISSRNEETNEPIEGLEIGLFDEEGNLVKINEVEMKGLTDQNGNITFSNLLPGTYKYKEISVPDGYILQDTEYSFTIDEDGNVTFNENNGGIIYNKEANINIIVNKVWQDNDNQYGKRPEQIILKVLNGENVISRSIVNEDTDWRHTFTLPKYDSNKNLINYTVDEEEVNEKDLYFYSKQISGNTITNILEIPNDDINIAIRKVDKETKEPLKGAIIEITDENGNKTSVETDNNGYAIFMGLKRNKTYTYKEIKAPSGYILNDEEYRFTINLDGQAIDLSGNRIIKNEKIKNSNNGGNQNNNSNGNQNNNDGNQNNNSNGNQNNNDGNQNNNSNGNQNNNGGNQNNNSNGNQNNNGGNQNNNLNGNQNNNGGNSNNNLNSNQNNNNNVNLNNNQNSNNSGTLNNSSNTLLNEENNIKVDKLPQTGQNVKSITILMSIAIGMSIYFFKKMKY